MRDLTIEPFDYSDDSYLRAMAIDAAVFNEPAEPLAEWKHGDETWDKQYPFFRDFVVRDGVRVAFVDTFQSPNAYHPQKYEMRIFVDPAHDAADIRPFVLGYTLERLAVKELIALKSGMLDDKPLALQFFEENGFKPEAVERLSKLLLADSDWRHYEAKLAHVAEQGIVIHSVSEWRAGEADWQKLLYELATTVGQDIPTTGEKRYEAFEQWGQRHLSGPPFDPDAYFIALDGERPVGLSFGSINRDTDPPGFNTGMTGTLREYRRRGIATALKIHIIRHLHNEGVHDIFTSNDSQNPMYQLNLALGFKPLPSWVRVEKQLR